jgi:hypothetical protein
MATVPTPFTATAGDKLSASTWNTGVKDVFNWLLNGVPRCHVFDASGNSCAVSTPKLILFDGETYDNDGMHDTAVNPSRIYFQTAGRYDVDIQITMPEIGTYTRMDLNVRLNSGGVVGGGTQLRLQPYSDTVQAMPIVHFRFKRVFVAGDYLEVFLNQTSAATRVTVNSSLATRVFAEWLSTT